MNDLSNWILSFIAFVFLAPVLNTAHQNLHARFVLAMSQFNAGLAQPTFITWQVVVSLIFALSVIGSYLSIRNEKYQLVMLWLVIGVVPILFTYLTLLFIT